MDAVLSAEGITKSCRMGEVGVPALRGIDVQLGAGEMVVLLGASGSGKSTLLNIMGGLDIPTAGRILYRDQDLTGERARPHRLPPRPRRLRIPVLQRLHEQRLEDEEAEREPRRELDDEVDPHRQAAGGEECASADGGPREMSRRALYGEAAPLSGRIAHSQRERSLIMFELSGWRAVPRLEQERKS